MRQACSRVLIHNREPRQGATLSRPIHDKRRGPDVIGMFGASTETRAIRQPEACPLRLLRRDFQAVLTPDPLAPLMSGNLDFMLQ